MRVGLYQPKLGPTILAVTVMTGKEKWNYFSCTRFRSMARCGPDRRNFCRVQPMRRRFTLFGDSIEAWAAAALRLTKGDRLVVVGCSVGGSCALELAVAAPDRVA